MRKQVVCKLFLFSAFLLIFHTHKVNASGDNGKVTPILSSHAVTIGQSVTLSVAVEDMTNGTISNGSCNYTIIIPEDLLVVTESETPNPNNLSNKGTDGVGIYNHGSYTSEVPGIFTFDYIVTTGSKGIDNISPVSFHPLTPVPNETTDINLFDFNISWSEVNYADSYIIMLRNAAGDTLRIIDAVTDTSYKVDDLTPGTDYFYSIKSKYDELESLEESSPVEVTTRAVVIEYQEPDTFRQVIINTSATQTISFEVTDLQDDIHLQLASGDSFSIDTTLISKDAEEKKLSITFLPVTGGEHTDYLIINSLYVPEKRILLTGTTVPPAPFALPASDEKSFGFTANWEREPHAESYTLTVLDANTNIIEGYDNLNVGDTTAFEVINLLPNTTYTYTVKAVNSGASSASSNTITVTTSDGAVITHSQISSFRQEVNSNETKTIRVNGTNLIDKITLSISGEYFSIDKNELDIEGGSVIVSYMPDEVGAHTGELTLSSTTAQDVVIKLEGVSIPLPTTTLPATDITPNSFTAHWNPAENAAYYLLTVKQDEDIIFEDRSSEGETSFNITELASGKVYNYSVKVVENEQVSNSSDVTEGYTYSAPVPAVSPEKTAIRVKWPALPGAISYKVYLSGDEIPVNGFDSVTITNNEYLFTELTMNTAYLLEIISVYNDTTEFSSGIINAATNGDYGTQLRNSGFEYWEGTEEYVEPVNWNSFMTAEITITGGGLARQQKVKESNLIRPGSGGNKSAFIFSNSVLGVTANGNLTTGKIIAQSMTVTDPTNHNKTILNDDDFNAPFTDRPDSMTVWVKYIPKNATDEASITATLHDEYEYTDPSGSDPFAENHVVAKAEKTYMTAENNDWQRLSIPFEYRENNLSPAYMLVSFTTNKTPGKGSVNDSVFIDDILMIYKPELQIVQPEKPKYVLGETINISYILTGTMSPTNLEGEANIVYLELSDENGSFDTPQILTQVTTDNSGELTAQLANDMPLSSNYKLRIRTTNYPMISDAIEIAVRRIPDAPVAKEASDTTAASFVANWDAVEGADGYLLMVDEKEYLVEGGETTSYQVKNLVPETNYSYVVKTVVVDLYSEASNIIYVKTKDGGSITYDGNTFISSNPGIAKTGTLYLSGEGLSGDIYIDIIEDESGFFSIGTDQIGIEGGELEIIYEPNEIGIHTATLRFQSLFVSNVVITVTGTSNPFAVNTLDAEDITPVSFTAKWEASDEAESYLITVLDENRNVVEGYNKDVGATESISITGLTPETIYYYSVKVLAGGLESESSDEKTVITLKKPVINNNLSVKEFLVNINEEAADTIIIQAADLFNGGKVNIELSNEDNFSLNNYQAGNEEEIIITFSSYEAGVYKATLILSAEYADTVSVSLKGTARPLAVVALPATNTTLTSFVARWEQSTDADAYLLSVKNSSGIFLEDYNRRDVGTETSVEITDLQRLRNYTYYVEVLKNGVTSEESNIIEARTSSSNSGLEGINGTGFTLYPNPAKSFIFVEGISDGQEYIIIDTKGVRIQKGYTEGNRISVKGLNAGLYILRIEDVSVSFIKE